MNIDNEQGSKNLSLLSFPFWASFIIVNEFILLFFSFFFDWLFTVRRTGPKAQRILRGVDYPYSWKRTGEAQRIWVFIRLWSNSSTNQLNRDEGHRLPVRRDWSEPHRCPPLIYFRGIFSPEWVNEWIWARTSWNRLFSLRKKESQVQRIQG